MAEKKDQVYVDPTNLIFARVMEVMTYIGIAVMIIFGLLYLFGLKAFVNMKSAVSHWHLPVGKFWEEVSGIHISGYSWFLTNLSSMDCLSMIGICILASAPLGAIVAAITKVGKYRVFVFLFLILIIEYVFAILKPIIMPGVGGH